MQGKVENTNFNYYKIMVLVDFYRWQTIIICELFFNDLVKKLVKLNQFLLYPPHYMTALFSCDEKT